MRTVQSRIQTCRLIEKMERQEEYSKKLGLIDASRYKGSIVKPLKKRKLASEN